MTGVAAGWASGLPVYEATERPGGICSYYMRPGHEERLIPSAPDRCANSERLAQSATEN